MQINPLLLIFALSGRVRPPDRKLCIYDVTVSRDPVDNIPRDSMGREHNSKSTYG